MTATGAAASPDADRPLHRPAGSLASPPWSIDLPPERAGWTWTSLKVLDLAAGAAHQFATGGDEVLVLPLEGGCAVAAEGTVCTLQGRSSVFAAPTDFAYLPTGTTVTISTESGGRFAVPGARAGRRFPFRRRAAQEVAIELRGTGNCSRRVVNYCMAGFEADRLLVCEVFTPSGNWSSYPPHKHDEQTPAETALEEIYYFEIASGASGEAGLAYQRVYGPASRPIDLLAEVRQGDVVQVPHGYHGPSMAAPGYDLYYLNVMGGAGERQWLATLDPAHAWVRDTWAVQPVDPRLTAAWPSASGAGGHR